MIEYHNERDETRRNKLRYRKQGRKEEGNGANHEGEVGLVESEVERADSLGQRSVDDGQLQRLLRLVRLLGRYKCRHLSHPPVLCSALTAQKSRNCTAAEKLYSTFKELHGIQKPVQQLRKCTYTFQGLGFNLGLMR